MTSKSSISDALKDSAVLITVLSVLLFTWGFVSDLAYVLEYGVAADLVPRRGVQEYLLLGGLLAVTTFVPLLVLFSIPVLFMARRARRQNRPMPIRLPTDSSSRRWIASAVAVIAYLLSASAAAWTGTLAAHLGTPPRVIKYVGNTDTPGAKDGMVRLNGLYLVAYADGKYIFVDKPARRESLVIVVASDEVKRLVLSRRSGPFD